MIGETEGDACACGWAGGRGGKAKAEPGLVFTMPSSFTEFELSQLPSPDAFSSVHFRYSGEKSVQYLLGFQSFFFTL